MIALHFSIIFAQPFWDKEMDTEKGQVNDENEIMKPSMSRLLPFSTQNPGIAKYIQLAYPNPTKRRQTNYPVRIKVSRNSLKKHFKYPKGTMFRTKNLVLERKMAAPFIKNTQKSAKKFFHLKKERLRRHMNYINR